MSLMAILDTLLLKPLELAFEVVYTLADRQVHNPGLSILVLSLVMNLLVLPLYIRADAMQEEERDLGRRLQRGASHIKKTFKGDERMMMLQTYYRQNGYKPAYALRGAMPLLLQIPFFAAAYRFLSSLRLLDGAAFGPIPDLGRPDGMLVVAGMTIHALPIAMTAANLASCAIFTKGSPLKPKIQLYAMAAFFLVFLYESPSGLVLYWTLNNVFSLCKTAIGKLRIPERCAGIRGRVPFGPKGAGGAGEPKVFFAGGAFLSALTGALIPSAVIKASPQEFVDMALFRNPLWYAVSSFCLATGTFVVWLGVFYWLARPSVRLCFDKAVWALSGMAIANYMFFGKGLGILNARLQYEGGLDFSRMEQLWNAAILLAAAAALCMAFRRWRGAVFEMLAIGTLAIGAMAAVNLAGIYASIEDVKAQIAEERAANQGRAHFALSREGKNVIVFMLDRGMGEYVPYLFHEKPELREQFSGFAYYPNVVSFGGFTNFGTPPLFGGYEYTPVEMNKRDGETLASKQNEALKVMPVLFAQDGYDVTVCDPPYANYSWVPDLSIYNGYPQIKSYITDGRFTDISGKERWVRDNARNFFCHGILKAAPLCLQEAIYGGGSYNQAEALADAQAEEGLAYGVQERDGTLAATGIYAGFMNGYNVLTGLPYITDIADDGRDTFLMMANNTTHEPMLLQEPGYEPKWQVDNTAYESGHQDRFTLDGRTLRMETDNQVIHYQTNMAAMLQLGKWFDFMRENGVYDNTRIILVSDHGRNPGHLDELMLDDGTDCSLYYPLLMVKDFGSEGFTVDEGFMTVGDVPTLATDGTIDHPVNPFTGKALDSSEKTAHDQYIIGSFEWSVDTNNGNTFMPSKWYSVHDNIWDRKNWRIMEGETVLPPEG